MSEDAFLAFATQLTRMLGELDLGFERTVTPDGMRVWNVPFAVESETTIVTLYFVQGWVVALHAIQAFPTVDGVVADRLLRANANMFGAKAALNGAYVNVLADCRVSLLSSEMVWTMVRAVVFGAQQVKAALGHSDVLAD